MILFSDSGYVLHERAAEYVASGAGWLSLKTFSGGRAMYDAGSGTFAVDEQSYLVLNHGTRYTITIDSVDIVESCCIFWEPIVTASAYRDLTAATDALLVDPMSDAEAPSFVERTYRAGDEASAAAARLRAAANAGDPEPAWLDEQLHRVLAALLRGHTDVEREIAMLPQARAATRAELYRRLHLARDYAEAWFERPVHLAELAAVAGLSPNHLLRSFQQLFGCTPLQYLNRQRIRRACRLLRDTELLIADVCLAVGFQSFGSFSRTFRRHTGLSPSQYRNRSANGRE